jgi:hypothetical protein
MKKPTKTQIILVLFLILVAGVRTYLFAQSDWRTQFNIEGAAKWKGILDHIGTMASQDPVQKLTPKMQDLEKFSNHTFFVELSNRLFLRVGIDEIIPYEVARQLTDRLKKSCLIRIGGTSSNCEFTMTADYAVWQDLIGCPQSKSRLLEGLRFTQPGTASYLVCSPSSACAQFDQPFRLDLQTKKPTDGRVIGEIFNLIWQTGICDAGAPPLKEPGKIEKLYMTSNHRW